MAHDVFISHSAKDKATADAMCALLESSGIRCWVAPRDIQPGATWAGAIVDAIGRSRALVLVFSSSSNDSKQVMREVSAAADADIPIVPFRIHDTPPSRELGFFVGPAHWLDALTPPLETHLLRLRDTLRLLLPPSPVTGGPAAPPPRQEQPPGGPAGPGGKGLTSRGRRTVALLALVGLAGGIGAWLASREGTPGPSRSPVTFLRPAAPPSTPSVRDREPPTWRAPFDRAIRAASAGDWATASLELAAAKAQGIPAEDVPTTLSMDVSAFEADRASAGGLAEGTPVVTAPVAGRLESGRGILVVSGDAELVSDDFSPRGLATPGGAMGYDAASGFAFVAALVDWMTGSDELLAFRPGRWLTPRVYSLSSASRSVLSGLSDTAKISVFLGEQLATRAEVPRARLAALLTAMAAASGGRVEVRWVKMDEAGRKEAAAAGVREATLSDLQPTGAATVREYDGLVVSYRDHDQAIGPLIWTRGYSEPVELSDRLEYELAAELFRVSRPSRAVVGLVRDVAPPAASAEQRKDVERFTAFARKFLSKAYGDGFRDAVDLETAVPADVGTLVVAAPREWASRRVYHLEQFLLRGGRVLLLLDPLDVRGARVGRPLAGSGLEDWLDHVGVRLTPGVVGDLDEPHMGMVMTNASTMTGYPFFVLAHDSELNQSHPATRVFGTVPFYFPAGLLIDEPRQSAARRTLTVLATTSDNGFLRTDMSGLMEVAAVKGGAADRGRKTLLVELHGLFTSFWKGKPSPDDEPR